jgi:uncharacterized membrane protein YfcA
MLVELISYLIAGSMAGILAGMFGVGGGILIVPILTFIFLSLGFNDSYVTHLAVGTSLSTIIFTGLSSARAHFYKNAINFQAFYPVATGISIGCIAGAFVANLLDGIVLRKIIGIFALIIAIQIYIAKNQIKTFKASSSIAFISGSGIGGISTILGIGGGSFTVPFFKYSGLDMKVCIGTAAACGVPIALFGSISFIALGLDNSNLPDNSLGYVYLPALIGISLSSVFTASIGANIAHSVSDKMLSILFSIMMVVISAYMLF